jgi:hypothetical protein
MMKESFFRMNSQKEKTMKVKTKNNHFLFSMMVAALSLMSFATAHAAPGVHC